MSNGGEAWRACASRMAGRAARSAASRWLIRGFARHYHIAMEEAVAPEGGYRNLQQFFCRALRPELRPIAQEPGILVAPCDGVITAAGAVSDGRLVQAKGHVYTLEALLGDGERAAQFAGGRYATIYLAPADYHRVHAPAAGRVAEARYLPGTHWPVNPKTADRVPGLLAGNERLVTYLETAAGEVAVVMVGACLVGAIRVNYDIGWNAGPGPHVGDRRRYEPPIEFGRGQELGRFEFGSTVVLVTAAGVGELCRAAGERVRVGMELMRAAERQGMHRAGEC